MDNSEIKRELILMGVPEKVDMDKIITTIRKSTFSAIESLDKLRSAFCGFGVTLGQASEAFAKMTKLHKFKYDNEILEARQLRYAESLAKDKPSHWWIFVGWKNKKARKLFGLQQKNRKRIKYGKIRINNNV